MHTHTHLDTNTDTSSEQLCTCWSKHIKLEKTFGCWCYFSSRRLLSIRVSVYVLYIFRYELLACVTKQKNRQRHGKKTIRTSCVSCVRSCVMFFGKAKCWALVVCVFSLLSAYTLSKVCARCYVFWLSLGAQEKGRETVQVCVCLYVPLLAGLCFKEKNIEKTLSRVLLPPPAKL